MCFVLEMCFSASQSVLPGQRTSASPTDATSLASRVHRCRRRHSSSASSESLARYLLLPTAPAPAKRLSAAQFLSPPLLLLALCCHVLPCLTSSIQLLRPGGCSVEARLSSRLPASAERLSECVRQFSLSSVCLSPSMAVSIHVLTSPHLAGRSGAEDAMRNEDQRWIEQTTESRRSGRSVGRETVRETVLGMNTRMWRALYHR